MADGTDRMQRKADLAALAVIGLALAIRFLAPVDANIDWLVSNGRRFVDGATLYRDIVETNPPLAILIYLPAVWVERLTGLAAEPVVVGLVVLAGVAACLVLARAIRRPFALPALLAGVLVAPMAAFAEREHIALILVLPVLAVAIRRAEGQRPTVPALVVAGVLAGLAPAIKPHFALAIAAPYAALALRDRRADWLWRPEALVAAGVTLLATAAVPLLFPAYVTDVLPLLVDLYRPLRKGLPAMLATPVTLEWIVAVAGLAVACGRRLTAAAPLVLLAASAGFLAGFVDQGRGWYYHALPALALLMATTLMLAPEPIRAGPPIRRITAVAAVLAALVQISPSGFGYRGRGVVAPIRAAVAHPSVMSISFDLTPGHPITTEVGGTWAGTYSSRWITVNARHLASLTTDPALLARYDRWMAFDRTVTNRDLADRRPDVVLVGLGPFDWPAWIAADAETARLMTDYVPLARDELSAQDRQRFEGVEAWLRRDLTPGKTQ